MTTDTTDREYILAGLTGLLLDSAPWAAFRDKYMITPREVRRAACVAVQTLMQGGRVSGDKAVARVKALAQMMVFTKDELTSTAWEVLRGVLHSQEADASEIVHHVLRYFLVDQLPRGTQFGYTGMADEFQPRDKTDYRQDLIWDLVSRDLAGTNPDNLPTELVVLLEDVGLLTTNNQDDDR